MSDERRIKVAIITPNPTPYRTPFFRALAQCGEAELTVFFLTRGSATRPWTVEVEGFKHEFLREYSVPVGGKDMARYRINPSIFARLRSGRFDVVVVAGYNHFTTQAAILRCALSRTPWCLMSESHVARPRSPLRVFLKKLFLGPLLRTMGAAMVTGTLAARYVESFGVPPEAVFVVANTPDIAYFRDAAVALAGRKREIAAAFGVAGKRVILFVGRLLEEKGLKVLFDAYQTAKSERADLALVIVGDGARRPQYESLVREKGLCDVHFLGFRTQDRLPEVYAAADILALPSLVEPWGVVVNEAMASGLPVVLSDQVGASADLVDPGANGFVVPAGQSGPLAQRLLDVLSDEDRRLAMGRRSVEIIADWDYAASVHNFMAAVRCAIHRKGPANE